MIEHNVAFMFPVRYIFDRHDAPGPGPASALKFGAAVKMIDNEDTAAARPAPGQKFGLVLLPATDLYKLVPRHREQRDSRKGFRTGSEGAPPARHGKRPGEHQAAHHMAASNPIGGVGPKHDQVPQIGARLISHP